LASTVAGNSAAMAREAGLGEDDEELEDDDDELEDDDWGALVPVPPTAGRGGTFSGRVLILAL
jgi:hypothetical protein